MPSIIAQPGFQTGVHNRVRAAASRPLTRYPSPPPPVENCMAGAEDKPSLRWDEN